MILKFKHNNSSYYPITHVRRFAMRKTRIILAVAAALATIVIVGVVSAQQKLYQLSPAASVSQTVGLTDITVTYHRPGVKGRKIWGELVPYDKVWRAGANEATMVTFSTDVTIGAKLVKAGSYSFFVIPRQGEWNVIFNSQPQWGAFSYDSTKDVVRYSLKPETAPSEERLSYSFTDLTGSSVKLILRWEKIALPVEIEVGTDANFTKATKAVVTNSWQEYNNYALYCLDSKTNWDKGMEAVDRSIAINENPSNLRMKAELLAQAGKVDEAISFAEKAITVGKAANPRFDPSEIEDLLTLWKKR
jgi:tetratricopeptide (TPR) repeat protein